jgi:nucleoside-triphosphatase
VAEALRGLTLGGFYTEELREGGARVGFQLTDYEGNAFTLAHVDFPPPRVSRYGVDVAALDARVDEMLAARPDVTVYLVDEIGKMECLSQRFVDSMRRLLASGHLVVATVARKGGGFIDEAKASPGVLLWELTRGNRDRMPGEIVAWLEARDVEVSRATTNR